MKAQSGTQYKIIEHVRARTPGVDWGNLEELSASAIAQELNVSRTLVSQYLNEAVAAGTLIKINSRPVSFLHGAALAGAAESRVLDSVYDSVEELRSQLIPGRPEPVFSRLTGHAGSLAYCIEQCKAAISYPGTGLPILFHGPTGTGKSLLARMMYDYGIEEGILPADSRFVSLNCAEYANNPELLTANLFGHRKGAYTGADRDREGLLALANGGVLFLDEVHCLKGDSQEKLFQFMDQGVFHMLGDNEKWYTSTARLVMATTEDPSIALLQTLLRRVPIIVDLPSLSDRPKRELKALIYQFLMVEAQRVNRTITISDYVYNLLLHYSFPENVGQLENCLRTCVARALLDAEADHTLMLQLRHLPNDILRYGSVRLLEKGLGHNTPLTLEHLAEEQQGGRELLSFNRDILQQWSESTKNDEAMNQYFSYVRVRFNQYIKELDVNRPPSASPREDLYADIVKSICAGVGNHRGISLRDESVAALCALVNDYAVNRPGGTLLSQKNQQVVAEITEEYCLRYPIEYDLVREIVDSVNNALNLNIDSVGRMIIYICFRILPPNFNQHDTMGVLLARGSVASSTAAVANGILGLRIFEFLDAPMNADAYVYMDKISEHLSTTHGLKDIVILTDTEAVDIDMAKLRNTENLNIAIIGNFTLKLIVEVGEHIKKHMPLSAIVGECVEKPVEHHSVLIENRVKANAVLTVCATGIGTANQIFKLLTDSLPKPIDLVILPYDYDSLKAEKEKSAVFEQYNVLFVVGTDNPSIQGVPFFSLADLLEHRMADEIGRFFSSYFSLEELKQFNGNIVKQFSLQNLLDKLIVLRPEKVVNYVENIIAAMQGWLGWNPSNNVIVGLYIHIACLIERLITEKDAIYYEDLEDFQAQKVEFIAMVRNAFREVSRDYGVMIPDSEIAYLHDYFFQKSS